MCGLRLYLNSSPLPSRLDRVRTRNERETRVEWHDRLRSSRHETASPRRILMRFMLGM